MILRRVSIFTKLSKLEELVKSIKKLQNLVDRKKFLTDDIVRKAIERYLQLAIEATLDIADQIINEEGFRKPEDYKENIIILGENKILPKNFAYKFSAAAGFRNILVHDYIKLDNEKIFEHFKNDAKDIEKFMKYIIKCRKN